MSGTSKNTNRQKIADLLGLVVRAPRTVPELCKLTGMNKDNVRAWLKLWADERLLVVERLPREGQVGRRRLRYRWIGALR